MAAIAKRPRCRATLIDVAARGALIDEEARPSRLPIAAPVAPFSATEEMRVERCIKIVVAEPVNTLSEWHRRQGAAKLCGGLHRASRFPSLVRSLSCTRGSAPFGSRYP